MQASVSSLASSKSGSMTADAASSATVKHYADLLSGDEVSRFCKVYPASSRLTLSVSTSLCLWLLYRHLLPKS